MERFNGAFIAGCIGLLAGFIGSCIPDKVPVKPEIEEVVIDSPVDPQPEPKPEPVVPVEPKKEDPKPEPKPESMDGTIVMYTSDYCVWCTKWKAEQLQKVKDATWKFKEIYVTDGPVPRFEIHIRGKVYQHTGYMSMSALRRIVDSQ